MTKKKTKNKKGVTLMELMIAIGIAAVVTFAVAIMLADNLRAWSTMYNRMHSDEAENVYAVRRIFDRAVRSASRYNTPSIEDNRLAVNYIEYPEGGGTPFKCQALFVYSGTTLTVTCSEIIGSVVQPPFESWTIPNVIQCRFKQATEPGRAIQMLLTIDNTIGNQQQTFDIYACAYLNSL